MIARARRSVLAVVAMGLAAGCALVANLGDEAHLRPDASTDSGPDVVLEAAVVDLTGAPSALVFSTGYQANLAALAGLADAGTLIVSDEHAHASLIDGCRLSRAAVNVARLAATDPELALQQAVERFRRRFERMEQAADAAGRDIRAMSLDELEGLWGQAKRGERER